MNGQVFSATLCGTLAAAWFITLLVGLMYQHDRRHDSPETSKVIVPLWLGLTAVAILVAFTAGIGSA